MEYWLNSGLVGGIGYFTYYWLLHLPYMVAIYAIYKLEFKDATELCKLFHIFESQLMTSIYCYHIRQVKFGAQNIGPI